MPEDDGARPLDRVLDALLSDERRVVEQMADAALDEVPDLRGLPREWLERAFRSDFRRGLTAVREGRQATDQDVREWAEEAASFAREGISLEALLHSHRVSRRRMWELALEYAERFDLDHEVMLDRAGALWAWSDEMMVRTAEAYRALEARHAQRDRAQRDEFLHRMLRGTATDADVRERAPAYGLSSGTRYRAFRARARRAGDVASLRRAIEVGAAAGGRQPLITEVDGDLAGIAPATPTIALDAVVALGEPADLEFLAGSFVLASRVLETAVALGITGAVRAEDLSLLLAVGSEPALGDLLIDRYLSPLRSLEGFADVLEASVREYLRADMQVAPASRNLQVHPNTLRYRLRRFQELTGTDLRRLRQVFELWWALERVAMRTRSAD